MDVVFVIGRILFASIFVNSGVMVHLIGRRESIEYARGEGAPAPELLVPLSGVAIIVGGLSVILGTWGDVGCILIAGFLVAITPIMHAFWKVEDPQMRAVQIAMFTKNVSMLGAAVVLFWVFNQLQGEAPLTITDPLFDRFD